VGKGGGFLRKRHLHLGPLPSRERGKERGVEGGNEFREKERKETIRRKEFPLILGYTGKSFLPSILLFFVFILFCPFL